MSLNLPSNSKEVVQQAKVEFEQEVPESNPFLKASWLGALLTALGKRVFAFYVTLQNLVNALFPDKSFGEYLQRWLTIYDISNNPATQATGAVTLTGTLGSSVPNGTNLSSSSSRIYSVTTGGSIVSSSLNITSLTRSGNLAYAVTDVPHNLTTAVSVTISGAVDAGYNITATPTPISANEFTYPVSNTVPVITTGAMLVAFDSVTVLVQSDDFGQALNLSANEQLNLTAPIAGVNQSCRVTFDGITGGTDAEADGAVRDRLLERISNPVTNFNKAQIVQLIKTVTGVTRVWLFEASPSAGFVTIYFVRDFDTTIFPDAGEITTVKNKVLEIKPVVTPDANINVFAPTDLPVAFAFSSITPDTPAMRVAIEQSLEQFFYDFTNVGGNITEESYTGVISNTVDTETGIKLSTFTLALSGDIVVAYNELPTLGAVSF